MMMSSLEPANIAKEIESRSKKIVKPPSELELRKEERMMQKETRLAQAIKGVSKISSAENKKDAPPDPSAILDKIEAYRDRFPNLKSRNKVSAKSTTTELIDELHYIELQLGSAKTGTGGSMGCMALGAAMSGLELVTSEIWNPLGLNLQGLGRVTKDNMAEFEPIMDELMIKYGAGLYMSPEARLLMLVGSTVATVHVANSGDPRVAEVLKKMNKGISEMPGTSDL